MVKISEIIQDNDLELRRMRSSFSDAEIFFNGLEKGNRLIPGFVWFNDNINKPEDAYDWLKPFSIDTDNEKDPARYCRCFGLFVSGEYAGFITCGTNVSVYDKKIELTYYLRKKYEGQGIMSRSIKLLEQELFGKSDWNKIIIRCESDNIMSANVARRNGYKQEAEFHDQWMDKDGKYHNDLQFYKLSGDWKNA